MPGYPCCCYRDETVRVPCPEWEVTFSWEWLTGGLGTYPSGIRVTSHFIDLEFPTWADKDAGIDYRHTWTRGTDSPNAPYTLFFDPQPVEDEEGQPTGREYFDIYITAPNIPVGSQFTFAQQMLARVGLTVAAFGHQLSSGSWYQFCTDGTRSCCITSCQDEYIDALTLGATSTCSDDLRFDLRGETVAMPLTVSILSTLAGGGWMFDGADGPVSLAENWLYQVVGTYLVAAETVQAGFYPNLPQNCYVLVDSVTNINFYEIVDEVPNTWRVIGRCYVNYTVTDCWYRMMVAFTESRWYSGGPNDAWYRSSLYGQAMLAEGFLEGFSWSGSNDSAMIETNPSQRPESWSGNFEAFDFQLGPPYLL